MLGVRDTKLGIIDRVIDLRLASFPRINIDLVVVTPYEFANVFLTSISVVPSLRWRSASMQRDRFVTARLWLSNAETDPAIAGEIAECYAALSAFHAQQAVEMTLGAVSIASLTTIPKRMLVAICLRNSPTSANRFRPMSWSRRIGSISFIWARATPMPPEAPIRAPLWE